MSIVGIIANPASGKDVRRLVARASVFDNQEKEAIVRRALTGIEAAGGSCRIAYLDDRHGIVRRSLEACGLPAQPVSATETSSVLDTRSAAHSMKALGCAVVLTLGGDGTNRAVASQWNDAPLIPLSTGTNNVFPVLAEATVAGAAAGLIAGGKVPLRSVARQHKLIRVEIEGESDDLALIDAVLTAERFVGSRALLKPEALRWVLLTRAEPAAVGMTALGGLVEPLDDEADCALVLRLGPGGVVARAPIAPGYYREVGVAEHYRLSLDRAIEWQGPGVLAFDGERERELKPGQRATLRVARDGPWVVDVRRTLLHAAAAGNFLTRAPPDHQRSNQPAAIHRTTRGA